MDRQYMAEKLRELRGKRTQVQVASDLDIPPSNLAMYECGKRIPRDDLKIKIAAYYKCTVKSIFFTSSTH